MHSVPVMNHPPIVPKKPSPLICVFSLRRVTQEWGSPVWIWGVEKSLLPSNWHRVEFTFQALSDLAPIVCCAALPWWKPWASVEMKCCTFTSCFPLPTSPPPLHKSARGQRAVPASWESTPCWCLPLEWRPCPPPTLYNGWLQYSVSLIGRGAIVVHTPVTLTPREQGCGLLQAGGLLCIPAFLSPPSPNIFPSGGFGFTKGPLKLQMNATTALCELFEPPKTRPLARPLSPPQSSLPPPLLTSHQWWEWLIKSLNIIRIQM